MIARLAWNSAPAQVLLEAPERGRRQRRHIRQRQLNVVEPYPRQNLQVLHPDAIRGRGRPAAAAAKPQRKRPGLFQRFHHGHRNPAKVRASTLNLG